MAESIRDQIRLAIAEDDFTQERAEIKRVVEYAEANKLTIERIRELAETKTCVGDDANFICELPVGFRICFSIEQYPTGWCNHISISVDAPGKYPHPVAVDELLREFGFANSASENCCYIEGNTAVNVIEQIIEDADVQSPG